MCPVGEQYHPTGDEALCLLARVPGAVGDLVRTYPGVRASDEVDWLETWFQARATKYFNETLSPSDEIQLPAPPPAAQGGLLAQPIRLVSIQPHYFRGFRDTPQPILIDSDLVVIDGRNTSGKTSLAEALEWLFTGCLSRRESMELGSPHELENCVSNQFRPDDDETWVSATFTSVISGKAETFTLRRVLKEDYGTTTTSRCLSILFMDDGELADREEREMLDRLFASVPPILMQHTLRFFVESPPRERRQYFERLLHLDELTSLVSKTVIGDARLPEFPSTTGSVALKTWDTLGAMVQAEPSKSTFRRTSRTTSNELHTGIAQSLTVIARHELPGIVGESSQFEEIGTTLAQEQSRSRQRSFPLLGQLRPQRVLDDQYQSAYAEEVARSSINVQEAWKAYEAGREAARSVGSDRIAISRALKILLDEKIIQREAAEQTCPLCAYQEVKTLSAGRVAEVESWMPVQQAESQARRELQKAMDSVLEVVRKAIREHDELLPMLPSAQDFEESLRETEEELGQAVQGLRKIKEEDDLRLREAKSSAREMLIKGIILPTSQEECEAWIKQCRETAIGLENLVPAALRYRDALRTVEAAVGAAASVDPAYRLRESWLACFNNIAGIAADLRWEQAKRRAQRDLETVRNALMEYRKQFLESRRTAFNQGIETVWSALRADQYSSFSQLHIPPPSGRGFPVEIEVKAVLDDGRQQKEVDALRVFSESQVNALGIAAFVTRSTLLGHKLLIFDDPVQSMDEEHFRTFAEDVLTHVLDQGFQVILLTHNDMFARDVSHCHYDRPGYVTMSVRLSRREGCVVEEGNRRFSERLKLAEKRIDEGQLAEAWRFLRLSVERLYTVVYKKYGSPDFNPETWRDQAAEYMWNQGAGEIIEAKAPGLGEKLKDILEMTAAGSHDKPPRGETDLRRSIKLLKSLPSMLGVGG